MSDNKHLTDEEQRLLQQKIDTCEVEYANYDVDPSGGDESYVFAEISLIAYVNSLLAVKDAEIERLKARQITPEMTALGERYNHALNSDNILFPRRAQRDYECAIGCLVIRLLEETDNDPS